MVRLRTGIVVTALLAAGLIGGAVLAPELHSAAPLKPIDRLSPEQRAAVDRLQDLSDGFSAIASVVTPSVVTIMSEGTVQPAAENNPFSQFFSDPRFRQFFGDMNPQPHPFKGLGSGVIVREDGYILTNNHVVQRADKVKVTLSDGTEYSAKVVGTDPRSDIAVVKIDADNLPAVSFGDSDKVRIGDWVLAVGSPFSQNLQTTVTTGIVSATGRNGMGLNALEDFIQTDAAINPGNSGGALVNLRGELIGINTGIASQGGGSNGIGFAIPVNMARDVMEDIITTGKVSRGWLGVSIGNVDQTLAEALGMKEAHGAIVQSVVDGSPAADAGVKQGDVVVSFDGKPLKEMRDLQIGVAKLNPGQTVDLTVLRDGKEKRLTVELGEFPDNLDQADQGAGEKAPQKLGMMVEPNSSQLAQRYDLPTDEGLVVTEVEPNSPADDKGIRPGDIILQVNRQDVSTLRDYNSALGKLDTSSAVLFKIQRGDQTFFVGLKDSGE